jgi:hypothetical protein
VGYWWGEKRKLLAILALKRSLMLIPIDGRFTTLTRRSRHA